MRRIDSRALLVRSVPFGEVDVIATFFTEEAGKVSAMVRGARRSQRRFGGALEPIHQLFIGFEDKGKELVLLKEARLDKPRPGITANLEAMEAAGQALRWIRHLCPPRTPEPSAWASVSHILDELEEGKTEVVATFGLRLLTDMGYALELDRCVRCGRPCPAGRKAFLDAAGGGIVCTSCGGARRTMTAELRTLAALAQRGESVELTRRQASELSEIVEEAIAAHAPTGGL